MGVCLYVYMCMQAGVHQWSRGRETVNVVFQVE